MAGPYVTFMDFYQEITWVTKTHIEYQRRPERDVT